MRGRADGNRQHRNSDGFCQSGETVPVRSGRSVHLSMLTHAAVLYYHEERQNSRSMSHSSHRDLTTLLSHNFEVEVMCYSAYYRFGHRFGRFCLLMLSTILISGCYSVRTYIRYRSLTTSSELSQSIFLELGTELAPTILLSEGSTTGREISIRPFLEQRLLETGYIVVNDPEDATYVVQINHLSLLEFELGEEATLEDALGSALVAFAATSTAGTVARLGGRASVGAGLVVGAVGFALDSSTKHIAHTLTTDILITETVNGPGREKMSRSHETRLACGASKVNLKLAESLPAIKKQASASLSGLLPEVPDRSG